MRKKQRILVVDDDREIVRGLCIRLKAAGYEVMTAHDGLAGLEAATELRPDAMLLDIRMPVMDGLAVLAKLRTREETKNLPVIVLSANVAEKAKSRSLNLGARHFVEKPYDAKTIVEALQSALGNTKPTENPHINCIMDDDNGNKA